jgi:hypothetical protein
MEAYKFTRADGTVFVAEPGDDTAAMLTDAERADCDAQEWDAYGLPTHAWDDLAALLHCAECKALTRNLYGDNAVCAVCFG